MSFTLSEALSNENWKQAMNEELKALEKNNTWEITDLPMGKKSVGCKWVYTVKYRSDGTLEIYKGEIRCQRIHSDKWFGLSGNICPSSQK